MRIILFLTLIFVSLGMATVPPPAPTCKEDPVVNSEIQTRIDGKCQDDCGAQTNQPCWSNCQTVNKVMFKYLVNK